MRSGIRKGWCAGRARDSWKEMHFTGGNTGSTSWDDDERKIGDQRQNETIHIFVIGCFSYNKNFPRSSDETEVKALIVMPMIHVARNANTK